VMNLLVLSHVNDCLNRGHLGILALDFLALAAEEH